MMQLELSRTGSAINQMTSVPFSAGKHYLDIFCRGEIRLGLNQNSASPVALLGANLQPCMMKKKPENEGHVGRSIANWWDFPSDRQKTN